MSEAYVRRTLKKAWDGVTEAELMVSCSARHLVLRRGRLEIITVPINLKHDLPETTTDEKVLDWVRTRVVRREAFRIPPAKYEAAVLGLMAPQSLKGWVAAILWWHLHSTAGEPVDSDEDDRVAWREFRARWSGVYDFGHKHTVEELESALSRIGMLPGALKDHPARPTLEARFVLGEGAKRGRRTPIQQAARRKRLAARKKTASKTKGKKR